MHCFGRTAEQCCVLIVFQLGTILGCADKMHASRREASGLGLGLAPHSFLYRQIYVVIIRIRVRVRVKYI